ncbi:MAG: helix-turn-helix transcriptional regulator, partial [Spirochaetaceae bacterium]|nr:helix-turn-helix transcriptional regulator [Spirochaetaceae bacterium]
EIAKEMNITLNTQKSYRKNLYTKLNIHSRRELFNLLKN